MIKLIGIVERPPEHWLPELVGSVQGWVGSSRPAGLRGFVVAEVDRRAQGEIDAVAIVEQWWDDRAAFEAAGEQPGVATVLGYDGTFWLGEQETYVAIEYPEPGVLDGGTGVGAGGVRMVGTGHRRPDFTLDAFFDYWRDVHAPRGAQAPGIIGYQVNRLRELLTGSAEADAVVSLWWPDEASLEASAASPEMATAWEDVQNYALTTGTFWICREHVLIAPPATGPGSVR